MQTISKYTDMETLTAAILLELIDRIEIHEAEGSGKNKVLHIRVSYRFIGHIGDAVLSIGDTVSDGEVTTGLDITDTANAICSLATLDDKPDSGSIVSKDSEEADNYAEAV